MSLTVSTLRCGYIHNFDLLSDCIQIVECLLSDMYIQALLESVIYLLYVDNIMTACRCLH